MNLYVVTRKYRYITIYEACFAEDEEDVYKVMDWEKTDKPPLEIREVKQERGCFLSIAREETHGHRL